MHSANSMLTAGLMVAAVSHAMAVAMLIAANCGGDRLRRARVSAPVLAAGAGGATAWAVTGRGGASAVLAVALLAATLTAAGALRQYRRSAVLVWVTLAVLLGCATAWGTSFLLAMPVSPLTRALLLAGAPLALLTLPVALVRNFQDWEVLCRTQWRRPNSPLAEPGRSTFPHVALHVPTHSEPSEVVTATLDCLARLDYPNFEVLVVDNNTTDPALWRPVEAHCEALGDRFRFIHVEELAGAKAGALNLALTQTGPDVELVSVVDADYQAEPDFLSGVVGYFDDPAVGFVQTPHAYRDWEGSTYLSMCRWEYAYF